MAPCHAKSLPIVTSLLLTLSCPTKSTALAPDARDKWSTGAFPPCRGIEELVASDRRPHNPPQLLPIDRSLLYVPTDTSYLNAATLGPVLRPVLRCAVSAWEVLEADPHHNYPWGNDGTTSRSSSSSSSSSSSALDDVRRRAADLLGCSVDELALTSSTTESLNLVGEGLVSTNYLSKSDWVLTTDHEHGGGVSVWRHWSEAGKIGGIDRVSLPVGTDFTADSVVRAFAEKIRAARDAGRTYRVIAVSHVLTTTGGRLPLPELSNLAHGAGALLVVDGAQGPGNVAVDLTRSGADVYTVSAHKWLLAPTGSGLLYVREGAAQDAIKPAQLDGGYVAYKQSGGTVALQTVAGLGYALDIFRVIGGLDAAQAHGWKMREQTRAAITSLARSHHPGLRIISPAAQDAASSILTIALPPHVSSGDAADRLRSDFGVIVKHLPDREGGTPFVVNCIRLSHHVYTDESDVARFVGGLTAILSGAAQTLLPRDD